MWACLQKPCWAAGLMTAFKIILLLLLLCFFTEIILIVFNWAGGLGSLKWLHLI